jgi:hypothetical protein
MASRAENARNIALRANSKSGHIGASYRKKNPNAKWRAQIMHDGKRLELGCYENIEDAVAARKAAEIRLGFHPNHGRRVQPLSDD